MSTETVEKASANVASDVVPASETAASAVNTTSQNGEQWDDEAVTASTSRKTNVAAVEVLEMRAIDPRRKNHQESIAEKLKIEETRAQLAAAREKQEQTEREAARLQQEKREQAEQKAASVAPRFGAAAASLGGGSKWVPPHMRGARGPSLSSGPPRKMDVQDTELFPTLAAAEKILEEKEKQSKPVFKVPKKTPVGGGASWASKSTPKPAPKTEVAKADVKTDSTSAPKAEAKKESTPAVPSVAPSVSRKPMKKKKKDLSTFKAN